METELKVKEEMERLAKAGFIKPIVYADWLSNIVLVLKRKTGAVRICVEYRNLNAASPKDEYPMPMADMLVDKAAHNQMLSFMDGNTRYNQIMVAKEDIHKTAFMFLGHIGAFEYTVMPFGLRNAGGTYQRAMNSVFHDMIGHSLEVYIDDVVIKSPEKGDHKSIKGQAVADFLADHRGEESKNMDSMNIANADLLTRAHTCLNNPIYSVFPTTWKLYFDGSKTDLASGAGIVLEDPLGIKHCYSFKLDFQCTNNKAKYEALIIGLEMLVELGIQYVEILGDSMREATCEHIPSEENFAANEMAQTATGVQMLEDCVQRIIKVGKKSLPSVLTRGI
ncbi:unnamed protein product [Prunus armeniaca]